MIFATVLGSALVAAPPDWQLLAGAGAQVSSSLQRAAPWGPGLELAAEIAYRRQWVLQLLLAGATYPGARAADGSLAALWRLDVSAAVLYLGGAVRLRHLWAKAPSTDVGAAAVLGLSAPVGSRGYVALELRYGYDVASGVFPAWTCLSLRGGLRSGDF